MVSGVAVGIWNYDSSKDTAIANIGQSKMAFSFDIPASIAPDQDTDGDGLMDRWEIAFFGSISAPGGDACADPDGDGSSNIEEQAAGTNPTVAASVGVSDWDTDGDGLSNQFEIMYSHTNPNLADSNSDGIPDGMAWWSGHDTNADANGDGIPDIFDLLPLDPTGGSVLMVPGGPVITLKRPLGAVLVP